MQHFLFSMRTSSKHAKINKSSSNYFTEGEISCAGLRRFEKIFARKVSSIQFKVDLAHTAKIRCILRFRLSTAFLHRFRRRIFVHSKRSFYSTNATKIPENLPEQYFFARVKLSRVSITEAELLLCHVLIGFLMGLTNCGRS